jgi:hypothetical protein
VLDDTHSQASAARSQEVSTETFGAMVSRFDGKIGAFAYLLFILLYFPCQVDSVMIGIRLPLAFLPVYINIIIEAIKILSDTPIHNNELAVHKHQRHARKKSLPRHLALWHLVLMARLALLLIYSLFCCIFPVLLHLVL